MKGRTGFADSQTGPDQFLVSFQGNGHTSAERAQDYALLRAAQVSLAHGFGYFAVTDVTNTSSARPYVARQTIYTPYPPGLGLPPPSPFLSNPYQFGYMVEYDVPGVYFRPGVRLLIKCLKAKPEKPFTYDAAALEQRLKQKYKLP